MLLCSNPQTIDITFVLIVVAFVILSLCLLNFVCMCVLMCRSKVLMHICYYLFLISESLLT